MPAPERDGIQNILLVETLNLTRTRKGPGFLWRLNMREVILAILIAPVIFVVLWLVMAMF
jgi:hypothetical protein